MKFHDVVTCCFFLTLATTARYWGVEGFTSLCGTVNQNRRPLPVIISSRQQRIFSVVRHANKISNTEVLAVGCAEEEEPIVVENNLPANRRFHWGKLRSSALLLASLSLFSAVVPTTIIIPDAAFAAVADDRGATSSANAKITTGGASTLQSGRTIAITRGVNLDFSDFSNQNLKGVAFQQSIVRDSNFQNCNLVGASFFDATVDGSNFENADLTQANFEMAQFNRASLKNAVVRDMYVSGATLFTGIKDIENTDWTDTYLRKDQQKYLCEHPTAKGTNPKTGVDTRESLMCTD